MKIGKVVRIGAGKYGNVFAKIQFDGKRLSISGVEGPKSNGDARGSCGQIVMSPPSVETYAPGWDADSVGRFWETWDRWHLNDMRPGCEHQRKIDTQEKVEVVAYGLTTEAYQRRLALLQKAAKAQANGETLDLSATDKALINLDDWYKHRFEAPDADSPLSGCYEVKERNQKAIGWVKPEEHPRGMLMRPCGVCGYKYGSAWLHEDVPQEVLTFLAGLPETDLIPAWV